MLVVIALGGGGAGLDLASLRGGGGGGGWIRFGQFSGVGGGAGLDLASFVEMDLWVHSIFTENKDKALFFFSYML